MPQRRRHGDGWWLLVGGFWLADGRHDSKRECRIVVAEVDCIEQRRRLANLCAAVRAKRRARYARMSASVDGRIGCQLRPGLRGGVRIEAQAVTKKSFGSYRSGGRWKPIGLGWKYVDDPPPLRWRTSQIPALAQRLIGESFHLVHDWVVRPGQRLAVLERGKSRAWNRSARRRASARITCSDVEPCSCRRRHLVVTQSA